MKKYVIFGFVLGLILGILPWFLDPICNLLNINIINCESLYTILLFPFFIMKLSGDSAMLAFFTAPIFYPLIGGGLGYLFGRIFNTKI